MEISKLKGKRILILGFGREGQDSFLFLKNEFPKLSIGVADEKPRKDFSKDAQKLLRRAKTHLGKDYLNSVKEYQVIIKAPGIPYHVIEPFLLKRHVVISATSIFFANCPGMIIGITGTKGKSTTASLVHSMLEKEGLPSYIIGNIGKAPLQFLRNALPDDIYVYELSSFQLENMTESPDVAVFLNLYKEHLNHHKTFAAYKKAKANITAYQTEIDFLVYNEKDEEVKKIAEKSKAQKLPFIPKAKNTSFLAPAEAAAVAANLLGVSSKSIYQAIKEFKTLPHRLERVGEYKGITFYNDSLATIPEATIAALDTLGKEVSTLIVGGFDRGVDYKKLAKRIAKSNIHTLILFPTTGEAIWKHLAQEKHVITPSFVDTMDNAVRIAYENTKKGDICLLSPAASSFNLFRDYSDRGEQFTKAVIKYGTKQ